MLRLDWFGRFAFHTEVAQVKELRESLDRRIQLFGEPLHTQVLTGSLQFHYSPTFLENYLLPPIFMSPIFQKNV